MEGNLQKTEASGIFLPQLIVQKTNKHTVYSVMREGSLLFCRTRFNTNKRVISTKLPCCVCCLFFFFLYLSDCAASPTLNRFAILSFCLKPLHSHRALHVCSHDNLSSPRSSFLLPLSPLSRATGEKGEDVRKASVASYLGLTQGHVDSFVIRSSVRTGRLASDVTGTQSKN